MVKTSKKKSVFMRAMGYFKPLLWRIIVLTILGIIAFTLFFPQLSFSSIYYILAGGFIGVIAYLITSFKKKEKAQKEDKTESKEGE